MSNSVNLPHLGTSGSSCTVQPQVMISFIIAIFGGFSGALRFLSWAVACSWNPTVVSVLPAPHWGRSCLLTAESLRGVWPFSCSLPSGYSPRYPPTVHDQKKNRPFMDEKWTPVSYKINFVPHHIAGSFQNGMEWCIIIPRHLSAQGKAIKN